MDLLVQINDFVNGIVWGVPLLVLIFATGVYFTVRLGFFQFRHPILLVKHTIVKAFQKKDDKDVAPGELTSFQAAMTSVSAIVGSGNIAGVATALVAGGPGALLWMIVAAMFGMASKFAEITLGITYREMNDDGTVSGGAMYYLEKGLHQKWLGFLFSLLVFPFAFVISGIVDTNTIATTLYDHFQVPTLITGLFLAAVVGVIVFGGGKRGQVLGAERFGQQGLAEELLCELELQLKGGHVVGNAARQRRKGALAMRHSLRLLISSGPRA